MNANSTFRPTDHLQFGLTTSMRWLNISGDRLFLSQVERLRATYTFNPRMFLRTILQHTRTDRTGIRSGTFATQLLFAYKLNWQTVFYVGGGDLDEVLSESGELEPSNRQLFAKVSYAFQR